MKALISADSAINQVETGGAVKANLKGEAGILETEIKLDSARGKDVEKKQEQLADIESRNRDIESAQLEVLNRADKELDKAAENNNDEIADKSTNSNKEQHEATADNSIPEGVVINLENPVGNNVDEIL